MRKFSLLILFAASFFLTGIFSDVAAQTEDTTRTDREGPEPSREIPPSQTPYNIDVPESSINRYQINNTNNSYTFYKRLRTDDVEDYLLREETDYDPYGPEWERRINEELKAIIDQKFKETHPLWGIINRIMPFLGVGFFRDETGPDPPRIEHHNKVPVENE